MKKILVLGATAGMIQEALRLFARDKNTLYLTARNNTKLEVISKDLKCRGALIAGQAAFDFNDFSKHAEVVSQAHQAMNGIDLVLIAHGWVPDQQMCQSNFTEFRRAIDTNFLSAASLSEIIAGRFETDKKGTLVVISSVAADRGRKELYAYNSAKAALDKYLEGLRQRLYPSGVAVITIKPGLVDTPMTAGIKKGILVAGAESAGRGIYRAIQKKKDVVYLPWFWRYIMLLIRLIPEKLFKKISLGK